MRLRPMAILLALAILVAGVFVVFGIMRSAGPIAATEPIVRVAYVSFLELASDDRGQRDFVRFRATLDGLEQAARKNIVLELVEVAQDRGDAIDAIMRDIVLARPAAIIATSQAVLEAAQRATDDIPVLFVAHCDPVAAGYVRSIAAPGVKRTGFTFHAPLAEKAIELLHDAFPGVRRVGVLADSVLARSEDFRRELRHAGAQLHLELRVLVANDGSELGTVLQRPEAATVDGWFVPVNDALWNDEAAVLARMRDTHKPVVYERTQLARKGGLMSYEARLGDPFRILASQLLLVLDGVDPATIPVERPSRFELAINLAAAGAEPQLRPRASVLKRANVVFAAGASTLP